MVNMVLACRAAAMLYASLAASKYYNTSVRFSQPSGKSLLSIRFDNANGDSVVNLLFNAA
jgi:hypothetical protein